MQQSLLRRFIGNEAPIVVFFWRARDSLVFEETRTQEFDITRG